MHALLYSNYEYRISKWAWILEVFYYLCCCILSVFEGVLGLKARKWSLQWNIPWEILALVGYYKCHKLQMTLWCNFYGNPSSNSQCKKKIRNFSKKHYMNLLHYEATLALAWHLLIYNRISDINPASLHEVLYKKHICISKS